MATFNLDELSQEAYDDLLRRFVILFVRFRLRMTHLHQKPLATQYLVWWISKGPTGFKSNDDALKFKRDLYAKIETFVEQGEQDGSGADEVLS